jgi:hypothetical protein
MRSLQVTVAKTSRRVKIQGNILETINGHKGLRQTNSLACLLFNVALQWVIRDAGTQTRGTIFNKLTQILLYADDIMIVEHYQL